MAFDTEIKQDSYTTFNEGTAGKLRLNPRGELVTCDLFTQLVFDGRVFNISPVVQETGDLCGETSPGADNVNPSLLIDVPEGTTAIPLEVTIMPEGTGTTGDWPIIRMSTDDKIRYASGGSARTPVNMRKDDPVTAACTAYSGSTQIVTGANTDDDTIWLSAIDTSIYVNQPIYWSARTHIAPVLVGPAALLIYIIVSNADEEILYSVKWAEIPTVNVT